MVGEHLIHDVLRGGAAEEVRVAVATTRHEVVLRDLVRSTARGEIDRGSCARPVCCLPHGARHTAARRSVDVVGEAEPRHLREATLRRRHQRDAVLEHRLQLGAVHRQRDDDVAERKDREHLAASDQPRRRREGRTETAAASGGRARERIAETARVRDRELDSDGRVLRSHGVGRDVADERLAEPAVDAPADVRTEDLDRRRADRRPQDRLQLRVQGGDPGLNRRIRRHADRPRLVEVRGLVDDATRARVQHDPHAREPHALRQVLDDERAVRPRREDLEVRVVADDDIDARQLVGEVEERPGRCRERAGRGPVVAHDHDDLVILLQGVHRRLDPRQARLHRERVECPREDERRRVLVREPDEAELAAVDVEAERRLPLGRRLPVGPDDVRRRVRERRQRDERVP